MALFESYERRIDKINGVLAQYGISSVEECREICQAKGFDPYEIVKGIQPICFENACWAYTVGAAIALKKNVKTAAEAAEAIGIGLQAFCIDGSVAEDRKVGLGHGNLGAMLLRDETKCFAFLAGHESFAAAEGAIGIARSANKARKEPLRVILNGLGKDAAQIISRINGFTYVQTQFDYYTGTVMDHIRYGKLDATDEECIHAAKLANADDFITRLPDGYNTMLTSNGGNLSQGQRQLIAIARAAVADPPVMILDEATSSIDTHTEALVQAGMDALMKGRTVFVIAHRLSTVRNSDCIMVLDHGRIIERGTHDDLIAQKGTYYQLYTGAFELD